MARDELVESVPSTKAEPRTVHPERLHGTMRSITPQQAEQRDGTAGARSSIGIDAFFVACALGISVGSIAVAIMLLASFAFSHALTIAVPFIATFHGYLDSTGTNAVSVTGSWLAVGILVVAETALMWAIAWLFREQRR